MKVKSRAIPHLLYIIPAALFLSSIICCSSNQSSQDDNSAEINVAAAANLTDAFTELGKQFTAQTGVRVVYSFGATTELAKQIENGAPFDLFASADVERVENLNRQGLLEPGTQALFARGRLVLWIPPGSTVKLERLDQIASSKEIERIAIAKPDVAPYGRAAVEALRAMNLWATVEPKVIYGQSVAQVRQYAATGNADVAFIPLSLVRSGEGQVIEVDERWHAPIDQAMAILKDSGKKEAARRFEAFVLSAEGQALLERYGYRKPL
jgi:molybdate transport system substrate-binding protein